MKPSLDRTVKLLWLVIGALLLLFLVVGGVMILSQVIGNAGAGSEAVRVASGGGPAREEPRAVRYGMPAPIRGTATRIVMVNNGTAYGYGPGLDGGGYASSRARTSSAGVNVMFVDGAGVRLLLDRPAYVQHVDYPVPRQDENEARSWITYQVALDDTNRDGRLDQNDAIALYVTDLEGRNLRPVLSPPLRYQSHEGLGPARILVYALQAPAGAAVDDDRMRQRAFLYDVAAGRLAPYAALDSAAERAGRILQR